MQNETNIENSPAQPGLWKRFHHSKWNPLGTWNRFVDKHGEFDSLARNKSRHADRLGMIGYGYAVAFKLFTKSFSRPEQEQLQTFEDLMEKYSLTDEDVLKIAHIRKMTKFQMIAICVGFMSYGMYHAILSHPGIFFCCAIVSVGAAATALRYAVDQWRFENRKLGGLKEFFA